MVGVQVEPVGQGPLLPTVQLMTAGFVGVEMHRPLQGAIVAEGQNIVGVQIEPVGQGPLLPTMQGITGGPVGSGPSHTPPQPTFSLQMEPVGQVDPPPNSQATVKLDAGVGVVVGGQATASGRTTASKSTYFILTNAQEVEFEL